MPNREEVAKKLRESGKWLDKGDTASIREAFYLIEQNINAPQGREFAPLFDRLADLIDPTCKNKQVEINKMAPVEFKADNFICSNCGETFCADKEGVNAPIEWSYCPCCGSRVVRDED